MRKVKILHIIGNIAPGGCEKQLLELCRRIDKEQFELSILWYTSVPDAMDNEFRECGVATIFFDKFSMPLWRFFHNLRKSIKEVSPDIVHTWLYSANFWGRWAALSCGIAHLISSYRNEAVEKNIIACLSEKLLCAKTIKLANSMAVAKSMEQSYGIPAQEIKIVYNAISSHAGDVAHARIEIRNELQLPIDQKIVLMVARQAVMKNYPMFIRTARRVCAQRPDVTFVSVGRGDMMEELNALVAQIGVTGSVIFVGQRYDVQRWLAAADLFCFTSNSEGFPNAILEAMVAGLPVVTTNYPAVTELITQDNAGVIVPLDDDQRMAEEILHLLDNPGLAYHIAGAAQAMIGKRFTWEPLLKEMESLYLSLVK